MSAPSTILVGIDEAGYGPTLGPLTVGMSVFSVPAPPPEQPPVPCLWRLLADAVCREPGRGGQPDKRGRVAIADSKQLKLATSVKTTHPLVHLERGVLTMLACAGHPVLPDEGDLCDARLLAALGAQYPSEPWYLGEPCKVPFCHTVGQLRIAMNQLDRALRVACVEVLAMRCRMVGEREFNDLAREGGKAATTARCLKEHLSHAWERWGPCEAGRPRLGIVCDRQGGRAAYTRLLESAIPGVRVSVVEESETRSRYTLEGVNALGQPCRAAIVFLVEAERHHLPVALASMIAKLTRELAMARFNRYWSARALSSSRELKPTAGYATDAGRWLRDARDIFTRDEERALVRIA